MGRFAQTIGAFRARGVFSGGLWWEHRRCWQAITVRHSRGSWERVDLRGGCLVVTEAARDAIRRLCRETGRQALLLSWPGGAVCLPSSLYAPSAFDVIIGHVSRAARSLLIYGGSGSSGSPIRAAAFGVRRSAPRGPSASRRTPGPGAVHTGGRPMNMNINMNVTTPSGVRVPGLPAEAPPAGPARDTQHRS
jgi:hypothetical protein